MSVYQHRVRKIPEIISSGPSMILLISAALLVFFMASNLGVAGEDSYFMSLGRSNTRLSTPITDQHQVQQLQHDLPQSRLNHEEVQFIQEDNSISEAFYHQQPQPMAMFSSTVQRNQQRNTKQKLLGMCEMECQKNYETYLFRPLQRVLRYSLTSPPTIGMTVPPTRQLTSPIRALTEPGNDGIPAHVFPLERCQGDCDGDADCAEGLLCYFRDGYAQVPGCSGAGYENTDYCIDKRDDPAKPPVMGAFRLKMYWEYGYNWQETFREANWCMQCLNATCYGTIINLTANCIESRCDVSDIITLRPCGIENTWFEFTNIYNGTVKSLSELAASYTMLKGIKYDRFVESYNRQVARAYFQFTRAQYEYYGHEPTNRAFFTLPADLRNGAEETFNRLVAKEYFEFTRTMYDGIEQLFHLRIATTDLCLELLNSRRIEVQPCDYYSDNQKFRPGEGNFFGKRFELSPVSSDGCLTQSHHPRDYEMIYRNSCEIGRKSNTTYYNKY